MNSHELYGFPEHRAEPESFNGQDDRPMPSQENHGAQEQDSNWLLSEMIQFRKNYGRKPLIRLLAEAIGD